MCASLVQVPARCRCVVQGCWHELYVSDVQEAMYYFRFMAAGQALILLGLFLWLHYMTNQKQAPGTDQNQHASMLSGEL